MKIKKHIAISDSGIIYNGATGDSFSINPIATEIFNMIKADQTEEQIKMKLSEKYEIGKDRLDGDLYDFLSHLRHLNILESDED